MSTNLINQLMNDFKGDTLNGVGTALGENTSKIQTALGGVLPALIGGLANKASTTEGANSVLELIRRNNLDSSQYADTAGVIKAPNGITNLIKLGGPLLDFALGGRTNSVTDWVSSLAGTNRSSSSSLLSLALPVVLGQIGRLVKGSGGNASSLVNLLAGQKEFLQGAPGGLTSALGLAEAASTTDRPPVVGTYEKKPESAPAADRPPVVGTYENKPAAAAPADRPPVVGTYENKPASTPPADRPPVVGAYKTESKPEPVVERRPVVDTYRTEPESGSSWWKWALPLLALLGLLGYFLTRRETPRTEELLPPPRAAVTPEATTPASPNLPALVEKKLPTGIDLKFPTTGVENKLVAFIEDPNRQVDKTTWFSFDRLEFETDSAQLKPTSQEQLRNVSEILKAYPQVNLKIGGYTDNVGNPAYNLKLSGERAANTMNELASLGIDKSRLAAEGYGQEFPVADNATEEGRQRNRRIDLRVTKK